MKKILLLAILLLLINCVSAATIQEINTTPKKIGLDNEFSIYALLEGDTCSAEVKLYLDNVIQTSKVTGCGRTTIELKTIDPSRDNLECGNHSIRVELFEHSTGVMNVTKEISVGNQPNVNVINNYIGEKILLNFSDSETGKSINSLRLDIYNTLKGIGKSESHNTDSDGTLLFQPKEYGEYTYIIDDSEYCGTGVFYSKKTISVQGPYPETPMAGELISLAVPKGVGLKVLDSDGNLYSTGILTNLGGGINLTIDSPGNYKLSLGDINSLYWSKNISLTVLGKENTTIRATPAEVLRGEDVLIEVFSEGKTLPNTKIQITEPSKQVLEYSTNENGSFIFKPTSTGKYKASFEDDKHTASEETFEARNQFKLDYTPAEPSVDGDINVYARDQLNNLVQGATISVEGATYGLTGSDGKYTFRLSAPGTFNVTATKEDFWTGSVEMRVISPLYIQLKQNEVEYGLPISLKILDSQNKEVPATIKVIKPSGAEILINNSFISDEVGVHEIIAEEDHYISSTKNFTVTPMPIELSLVLVKDTLYINTTSRDVPLAGITLLIEEASTQRKLVTDEKGSASFKVPESGKIKITANGVSENPRYSKITVVRNVNVQRDTKNLLIGLSIIAFIALLGVALVYLTPKKEEPRRVVKPYFSNKKNKTKTGPKISR